MIITSLGQYALRFQVGDTSWVVNPSPKQTKCGAQVALCTSFANEVHSTAQVTYNGEEPFVVDGPGVYESADIHIEGALAAGREFGNHLSTVYRFQMDDISVVVFGPGVQKKDDLESSVIELSAESDILVVSFSKETVVSDLAALVVMMGPRLVIPTGISGEKDGTLQAFVKELGKTPEVAEKVTLKRRDFDGKQQDIIVLTS